MSATFTHAQLNRDEIVARRTNKIATGVIGSAITGVEVWGAALCFSAGGGWIVLGVLLVLFAMGTFSNTVAQVVS